MQILALDSQYQPHRWISVERAMHHEATDEVLDHLGESIYIYRGGVSRMTGVESRLETSSIIVVSGAPGHRHYKEPSLTNPALFQRDRNVCAYCGGLFKAQGLTRDHIHPTSKGGRDVWMNVVTACGPCNSMKSDMMPGQKLPKDGSGRPNLGPQGTGMMAPLYVPYVPCRAEHMLLKNRSIKIDQMEFLLSQIKNKSSRVFDYANEIIATRRAEEAAHA